MGMCIVYCAVPALPGELAEQGFGRIVPLTIGPMIAGDDERGPLRRAAKTGDWAIYLPPRGDPRAQMLGGLERMIRGDPVDVEPVVLAAVWGGPPAAID